MAFEARPEVLAAGRRFCHNTPPSPVFHFTGTLPIATSAIKLFFFIWGREILYTCHSDTFFALRRLWWRGGRIPGNYGESLLQYCATGYERPRMTMPSSCAVARQCTSPISLAVPQIQ